MSDDPKTIAIDTSAVLERQRSAGGASEAEIPKTIAIDSQELADRIESARQESAPESVPAPETSSRTWLVRGVIAVVIVVAGYLILG